MSLLSSTSLWSDCKIIYFCLSFLILITDGLSHSHSSSSSFSLVCLCSILEYQWLLRFASPGTIALLCLNMMRMTSNDWSQSWMIRRLDGTPFSDKWPSTNRLNSSCYQLWCTIRKLLFVIYRKMWSNRTVEIESNVDGIKFSQPIDREAIKHCITYPIDKDSKSPLKT